MGFYGNLMHKYKNNEITILQDTICSTIFYFINYIQFFNLNKKIINITEFLDFITTFIRICQKMMILPHIPRLISQKYKCEICFIAMIAL